MLAAGIGVAGDNLMTFFDIILSTRASLHPEVEPDEFISAYQGVIRAEGDDGVLHRVGRAHAWRIHMGLATNLGESLLDIFDAHSQPMCDLYAALFDPETDYMRITLASLAGRNSVPRSSILTTATSARLLPSPTSPKNRRTICFKQRASLRKPTRVKLDGLTWREVRRTDESPSWILL